MRFKIILFSLALFAVGASVAFSYFSPEKKILKTHLTIYVEPPVLLEGGGVIVAGRPIPEAQWRALKEGYNPVTEDPDNPKKLHVKEGDRHFGAIVTSPASAVEFFYPENGSYTFNFRILPKTEEKYPEPLVTELITFGSGGIKDPETGEDVEWPSKENIRIHGKKYQGPWVQMMSTKFRDAFYKPEKEYIKINHFLGSKTLFLTPAGIERYIRENK